MMGESLLSLHMLILLGICHFPSSLLCMPPGFYCKFLALPAKVAEDTITKVRKVYFF
ncbi:hypothetical protein ACJW31_08G090700 [Castanea mollissima]